MQIMTGVLGGNMLAAWFLYGCYRASKILDGDSLDIVTAGSLLVPLGFVIVGQVI